MGPRTNRPFVATAGLMLSTLFLASLLLAAPNEPTRSSYSIEEQDAETTAADTPSGPLRFDLGVRYRFETVDDERRAERAQASTLRSTVAVTAARAGDLNRPGFGAFVQFEDVSTVGLEDQYSDAGFGRYSNGVSDRAVVADPAITSVLQAYVSHRGRFGAFSLGRMELAHGDQRFLGPVGWRQHHQTFDAIRYTSNEFGSDSVRWQVDLAHLEQRHAINGRRDPLRSQVGDVELSTHLGTVRWRAFAYRLEPDEQSAETLSTHTYGLQSVGSTPLPKGSWRLSWDIQTARQSEGSRHPESFELDYSRLEIGLKSTAWSVNVGQESLQGDGRTAFQTPLATLHKFNGWADQFLTTPGDGLVDRYLRVNFERDRWRGSARWHHFTAERGSLDYGDEIDAEVALDIDGGFLVSLKAAVYEAEHLGVDVTKAMAYLTWQWNSSDP